MQWWLLNFKINIQILGDLLNLNTDDGNHDDITHHKYYKGIADKADEEDDSERNGNHIEGQDTYHHLQLSTSTASQEGQISKFHDQENLSD